jgi:DNA-binding NarL/FixJ family response regulator
MANSKIQLLVVDDHPIFRKGLLNVLSKTNRFSRTHEASNGAEAIEILGKFPQIEMIFLDIEMPIMNGVEAAKIILAQHPNLKIIVTTMFCEPKYIHEMCKQKVSAYILKDSKMNEITKAIDMVLDGQQYYSKKVQDVIVSGYQNDNKKQKETEDLKITVSQKQVLLLLCKQYSNIEIAHELHISELTVKRHRQDLLDRTGSRNLAGLIIYAIENNIYSLN